MSLNAEDGPQQSYDVVVIGGGAVGLATAYHLRTHRNPCAVAVVERDPSYSLASTPRASGGVRRLFSRPENIELSKYGIPFYERFAELMAVDGHAPDIGFRKNGYLFIVPPRGVPALGRNFERQRAHKVDVQWLDPPDLKRRFPSMRVDDLGGATYSPDDGWLDPHSVLMALRGKVRSLGVDLIGDEVVALKRAPNAVRGVALKSGRTIAAGAVVNAAGAWAAAICAMIAMPVPITPLRRYEHYFESQEPIEPVPYVKDAARLAFRPEGKGYSGGVPTLEEPRGFNFDVDHRYFEAVVWPALAHRFPQFERTKCRNTLAGLYDQNDFDGNPIIGAWVGECENFYMAAGFSGHGLMHAPGCGRAIAELILDGRYESLDLARLGWTRIVDNEPYPEDGII